MRKNLFLTLALAFASFAGANAQNWSMTLSEADDLPGVKTEISGKRMYSYTSDVITLDEPLEAMRITFSETEGGANLNGFPFVCLSELTIFAADGVTPIEYTATSNADHNTMSDKGQDGDGLEALNDGKYTNYWHSCWSGSVAEYHHLELQFEQPVSEFIIHWASRPHNGPNDFYHNSPTLVGLTPKGVEFTPYADWAFTYNKEQQITSLEELKAVKYFVMQSNAPVEYDVYVNNENSDQPFGTKTNKEPETGPGSQFVNAGEVADAPTPSYVIQLIPVESGGYYLYFVTEGKFLSKNGKDNAWNGMNGSQGKTINRSDAAIVNIEETANGRFEMWYVMQYNGEDVEIHMGATPSTGGFKNVDKSRYDFYKQGKPYCLNYAYIIAFDWTLYEADMNYPTKYLTLPVKEALQEAYTYYTFMDSVAIEGHPKGKDDWQKAYDNFMTILRKVENAVATKSYTTVDQVYTDIEDLNNATAKYVFTKVEWYHLVRRVELENNIKNQNLLTPAANPVNGCYIQEVWNTNIVTNYFNVCQELYNKAYKDPYARFNDIMAFLNSVENNINAFLASKIEYVTLPKVYSTLDPHKVALGNLVDDNRYDWEQIVVLKEGQTLDGIRLTFLDTNQGNSGGGGRYDGYSMVALSGLEIVDGNGNKLVLTTDLVTSNSEEDPARENGNGTLDKLFDDDLATYYHSMWADNGEGQNARYDTPHTYIYFDIKFPEGVSLNTFTIKTIGRNNKSLAPGSVCITKYKEAYDPLVFRENPYNVAGGTQVTSLDEIEEGLYIISGNLRAKTQKAAPRFYSGAAPYHSNIKAAINDPCVYYFKKTANGWNIISLAKAQYWALNKEVNENKNEGTGEITTSTNWSTGLTVYPSNAAEIKIAESGNIENTFVFYSEIGDNMIDASWNWTNPKDTTDIVTVEKGQVNANKFVFMDWDENLAGRPCVSELPGEFTYGLETIEAHSKAVEFKLGDGYSAGDYLHFNKANGEGEWNIYKVTMDDQYYLWANNIPATLESLGLIVGKDPGCINGDIAALEAAIEEVEAVIENADKENAQAAVEAFVENVDLAKTAKRVEVQDGYWYAIESAYTEYYKQQGKIKAIYATEEGLAWKDAPAAYDRSAAEFVFQFQKVDIEDTDNADKFSEEDEHAFLIYSDAVGMWAGEGGGSTQVAMTDDFIVTGYVIKPLEGNIYTIYAAGANPLHTAGHVSGAGEEGSIVNWGGNAGSTSSWRIRFVDDNKETSINDLVVEKGEVVSVGYFTPAGAAIPAPVSGVNIVVTVYSNGVVETKKVLVK